MRAFPAITKRVCCASAALCDVVSGADARAGEVVHKCEKLAHLNLSRYVSYLPTRSLCYAQYRRY